MPSIRTVLVGPSLRKGRLCRVVRLADEAVIVQFWNCLQCCWHDGPSEATVVREISSAPAAPPNILRALRVPIGDWTTDQEGRCSRRYGLGLSTAPLAWLLPDVQLWVDRIPLWF